MWPLKNEVVITPVRINLRNLNLPPYPPWLIYVNKYNRIDHVDVAFVKVHDF